MNPGPPSSAKQSAEGSLPEPAGGAATTVPLVRQASAGSPMERPGDFIDSYKLIEPLGAGGFGVVWRAEQFQPIHRDVALKVIKPGMDTAEIIARFEAERQALALMEHPNIAGVLDAGATPNGRPYFVMELVRGVPLTDYCDEHKLGIRQRLELFVPVCRAVEHAHQKAILHRDLKPSNILVTEVDGRPVPKIIDFGIAKALGATQEEVLRASLAKTKEGMVVGTPQYMSPEQAGSVPDVDTRSDVYSLGAILHELLTGQTPLSGEQLKQAALDEVLRLIREAETKRPSSRLVPVTEAVKLHAAERSSDPKKLGAALRGDLDWIVLKALEKERARRYGSVVEFAEDIQLHLRNEIITARRPSRVYVLAKVVRRNRVLVGAAAAILVSMLAAVALSLRSARKERLARTDADAAVTKQRAMLREASMNSVNVAHEQVKNGAPHVALAYAAKALEFDPENKFAAAEIYSLLSCEPNAQAPWPLSILKVQPGNINEIEFTPDGRSVMTASTDKTVCFWDVNTGGRPLPPLMHDGAVNKALFSPDGRWLATGCSNGSLYVWEVATGKLRVRVAESLKGGAVLCLAWSADGRLIASGGIGKQARVWDASTGKEVTPWLEHNSKINSVALSPDGKLLATGQQQITATDEGAVCVWSVETGRQIVAPLRTPTFIRFTSFTADGKKLIFADRHFAYSTDAPFTKAVSDYDNGDKSLLQRWTQHDIGISPDGRTFAVSHVNGAHTGRVDPFGSLSPVLKHSRDVKSNCFSCDGSWLATASWDGTARVWDVSRSQALGAPAFTGKPLDKVRLSSDCRHLLTADQKGASILIWSLPLLVSRGDLLLHSYPVSAVTLSPNGDRIFTGSGFHVTSWDVQKLKSIGAPLPHDQVVTCVGFSHDGLSICTAAENEYQTDPGYAQVWRAVGGRPVGARLPHRSRINSNKQTWSGSSFAAPVFDRLGTHVLAKPSDQAAQSVNYLTGEAAGRSFRHSGKLLFATYSADGKLVLTTGDKGVARIWDADSGELLHEIDPGLKLENIYLGAFDRLGKAVGLASSENRGVLWNFAIEGPVYRVLPHDYWVNDITFSADGRFVATSSVDYSARVWNAGTGNPITSRLEHNSHVHKVEFNAEGGWIITCSADGTARIYDSRSGQAVGEPLRHGSGGANSDSMIAAAHFAPKNAVAVTASMDRTARIWHLPPWDDQNPSWLGLLAAAVSGVRIGPDNQPISLPPEERMALRAELQSVRNEDSKWDRLRRWVLSDSPNRRLSPESAVSLRDYVTNALEMLAADDPPKEAWQSAVWELHRLDPSHPLMPLALANAEDESKIRPFYLGLEAYRTVTEAQSQCRSALQAMLWVRQADQVAPERKFAEQEAAHRAVLNWRLRVLGPEHPATVLSRNQVGDALLNQGKNLEAEAEYRAVLAPGARAFGPDHPNTIAFRDNLANALLVQRKHADAEKEFRSLVAARARVLGKEHSDTLKSRNQVGNMLFAQRNFVEAEAEYREVLAISERTLGPDHSDTLSYRLNVGLALDNQGKSAEAGREIQIVVAGRERALGKEHADTMKSRILMADALLHQGKHAEAEAEYRAVLAVSERTLGPEHLDTLSIRHQIGCLLGMQGKYPEAEVEDREVLAIRKSLLGPEDRGTLATWDNLAKALCKQAKYAEAEKEYRSLLAIRERMLGAEHRYTVSVRHDVGCMLFFQGRYEEAEVEFRTALAGRKKTLGLEHADTLITWHNLARALIEQDKDEEAEAEFRGLLAIRRRVSGAEAPDTLTTWGEVAAVQTKQGKNIEAEKQYRALLPVAARVMGADHADTLQIRGNLAAALANQGKNAEAEEELKEVVGGLERNLGKEHAETLIRRKQFADALSAQEKFGEAEREYRSLLSVQTKMLGDDNAKTLASRESLAENLGKQGKYPEAEREHRAVLAVRERTLGAEHAAVFNSCYNLALTLEDMKRFQEALEFMKRAENGRRKVLGDTDSLTKEAQAARERLEDKVRN